jgi:uncharacterized protein (TIRG00374 family)
VRKRLIFYSSLALALGAVLFIIHKVNVFEVGITITAVGWLGFALFFGNSVLSIVFPALGWWILMRYENLKVSYRHLLNSSIMGFAINVATPSMYIGGEPIRVYYIGNLYGIPKRQVLASIIINKVQEITALVVIMMVCGWVLLHKYQDEIANTAGLNKGAFLTGLIATGIGSALLLIFFLGKMKPSVKILSFLIWLRIFPRKLIRLRKRADQMEDLIHEALFSRWRSTATAGLITALSAVSIFLRPAVFFWFLDGAEAFTISDLAVIYVFSQLFMVVPLTPGGVGLYELSLVLAFSIIRAPLGPEYPYEIEALAFAALVRVTDITMGITGGWMMAHYGIKHIARVVDKSEQPSAANPSADNETDQTGS